MPSELPRSKEALLFAWRANASALPLFPTGEELTGYLLALRIRFPRWPTRQSGDGGRLGAASTRSTLALRYAIPIWERGGIFNGMTGAQLKQLRKDLGDAIGRPLTDRDFAKLCGLPPESGGGTILEWENGYGPIGPVAALLSLVSVASDRYPIDEEIISESDAAFYRAMMRAGIIRRIG
jgi:hypothetical protein